MILLGILPLFEFDRNRTKHLKKNAVNDKLTTNLLELFPEFLNAPVSIYTLLHIALNCMPHKDMFRNIVHAILVA